MNNMENKHDDRSAQAQKRDTAADKKKIKKIIIIIVCVFAVLALLIGVLSVILELVTPEPQDTSYNSVMFFEADYGKNILDDELYLSLDRGIRYNRDGIETVLTDSNAKDIAIAAPFFYDYINCIINGEYENYPSFFTEDCLEDKNFKLPEKFTMQGLYDINISLYEAVVKEERGEKYVSEIYEVRYRIYQNNGTFRNDILPDETRTLVFELYISDGEAKINAIAHRSDS